MITAQSGTWSVTEKRTPGEVHRVIERNEWNVGDTIVAIGDSFGPVLTYENGKIRGLDGEEPITETGWEWYENINKSVSHTPPS